MMTRSDADNIMSRLMEIAEDQETQKKMLDSKWAEVCQDHMLMEIALALMTGCCLSEEMKNNLNVVLALMGLEISYRMKFGQPSSAPIARRET